MESCMEVSQNIKNNYTMISNLTFWYISKRILDGISKRYLHTDVHCSIIHNSQEVKAT